MKTFKLAFILLAAGFSLLLLPGCASEEKNLNTAEGLFKYAQEFDTAERYEMALTKYAEVKNKYPYSNLATEAELAIADVYYKRESFAESQVAYQNFRDLHPKHAKIDYVLYKTAMSFYMQLPETIDRDLSLGQDAIYHFEEIIRSYSKSTYTADAKLKRAEIYVKLAEKELYVADFYFKQKKYEASLRRYEAMLQKYPGHGLDPKAHLGAARSAQHLNNSSKKTFHAQALAKKYSQTEEARAAQNEDL